LLLKGVDSVIGLCGREMCTAIGQVTPDIGDGPAPLLPINFVQQMQGGPFAKHRSQTTMFEEKARFLPYLSYRTIARKYPSNK
jgi:hypothetical protein